jgi:hypothetical protein
LYVDPDGHCWGVFSIIRNANVAGFGYSTTCANMDQALRIVQHPEASTGQRIAAGAYIGVQAASHTTAAVGSVVVAVKAAPAAAAALSPYIYSGAATVQTAAAAHPVAAAAVRGAVETAAECSMTGGGCQWYDYAWGMASAGVGQRLSQPCSFSEDTLVATIDGFEPISVVSVGDLVLAYHEENDSLGYYPIVAVWAHDDPVVVHLTIDGELVVTTPEHPFCTEQGEWLTAASLKVGDEIRRADWGTGAVEAITVIAGPQTMYNFTVAAAHTYFVGEGQWLVHNACPNPYGRRGSPAHQARVQQAEGRFVRPGGDWVTNSGGSRPEVRTNLPDGGYRYADLVLENQRTGQVIAFQVCRATQRGLPVARERRALQEMRGSGSFDHVFFLQY